MSEVPAKRRRIRFGLRTLLLLVAVACVTLGWVGSKIARDHQRNVLWSSLTEKRAFLESLHTPEGLRYVVLRDGSFSDEDVRLLRRFHPGVALYHRSSQEHRAHDEVLHPIVLAGEAPASHPAKEPVLGNPVED